MLLDVKMLEIDSILFTNLRVAMWWKKLLEEVFRLNRGTQAGCTCCFVIHLILFGIDGHLLFVLIQRPRFFRNYSYYELFL